MPVLADILAALAVAVLRWWAGREDLKNAERRKLALAAAEAAQRALAWKADHPVIVPRDPADLFRVRDDARTITLPPDDPKPPDAGG